MQITLSRKIVVLLIGLVALAFTCPALAMADVPVYRLYQPANSEHLYTTNQNEVRNLVEHHRWNYEGTGWSSPDNGTPVYRLYNPGLGNHLYTTNVDEVNNLVASWGWLKDNGGAPVYYSGGEVNIYRLYNENLSGQHLLTTDFNEYNNLPAFDWQQEGRTITALAYGSNQASAPGGPFNIDPEPTPGPTTGGTSGETPSDEGFNGTVFWTDGGAVYHKSSECPSLARSHNVHSGSIAQSGKSRPCNNCW